MMGNTLKFNSKTDAMKKYRLIVDELARRGHDFKVDWLNEKVRIFVTTDKKKSLILLKHPAQNTIASRGGV